MRGSTPCHGDGVARYGGNTSCVSVDVPGRDPILFDIGTGARYFGADWPADRPFRGTLLLSHAHWDHIQGLPFFPPLLRVGSTLDVYAPGQGDGESIGDVVDRMLCPPLFPVGIDAFPGHIRFHDLADDDFAIGDIAIRSRLIPHIGRTLGFRVEWRGASVAYLSDHQQPGVDVYEATDGVRELCDGVDLLIHDAQYTREEFARKVDWGHCTTEYATWLAAECGVGTLALFHHDPSHDDDQIDAIVAAAGRCSGPHVVGASEGLTLRVGGRAGVPAGR